MPIKSELLKSAYRATVTESAANTYTESTIDLNLSMLSDHVFILTDTIFKGKAVIDLGEEYSEAQLCYAPQSAIIGPDDPEFLHGVSLHFYEHTTSGNLFDDVIHANWGMGLPIAASQLYFGAKGVGMAAAATWAVKLIGYFLKVQSNEFLRMAHARV